MIALARIWRGVVRLDDADEYAGYIGDTGFTEYAETLGNRGAWMLRRDQGEARLGPCPRPRSADALTRREYHPAPKGPASRHPIVVQVSRP